MSDRATSVIGDVVRVLVVGDSEAIDETAAALSTAFDSVSVLRERVAADADQRLADTDVHCVVCAFDGLDSPSTFGRVRDADRDVPIVAVTDGSAAEEALEAGADDVLEPASSSRLVVTRVRNAAERYRLATERPGRRYRSILEESAAPVCVVDEGGAIDYVNAAIDDRMGYTPAELERTTLFRLIHPDDRASGRETLAEADDGGLGSTAQVTLRLGHADGTWHVADLHVVNRQPDPSVDGFVVTVTDPRPNGSEAEAFQAAIDRLDDAFFTVGPQWELRVFNEAAQTLFESAGETTGLWAERAGEAPSTDDGAKRPDRVEDRSQRVEVQSGTVVWDLLPDAIRGEFADRLREAAATGSVVEFETSLPSVDGRLAVTAYPSDSGLSISVSQRSDTEAPATDRDRFERFEAIVDALRDGIALLEGATITYANPALLDLTNAETLVGRDIETIVDDELSAAIKERSRSPLVRWMKPLTGALATDGERRSIDVSVIPLGSEETERTCCVIRDRRGSPAAAVSTLEAAVANLQRAENRSAVRESIVDAVATFTAADVVAWYSIDESVVRPTAVATSGPVADAELPPIDRRDAPLASVSDTDDAVVSDRDELEPFLSRSGIRGDRVLTVPIGEGNLLLATSGDPMGFDGIDLAPIETLARIATLALDRLVTDARCRDLERDLSDLEALVTLSDRIRDIERELFDADTRDAVERRLADGLVSLDATGEAGSIELAWIGDVAVGGDEVTPRTWAGRDGSFLETTAITADSDRGEPAGRTAATRESIVIADLDDRDLENGDLDDRGLEDDNLEGDERDRWLRLAVDRGFRAAISVPLSYDEFWYGTLTVYADRPGAFDERLRSICEHLATVAGYAITAIERKRALVSDSITELEVVVRADADPLTAFVHRIESSIDVRTVVPRSSGGTTIFCTIEDAEEEVIREAVSELEGIDSCRFVGTRANQSIVELVCDGETLAETLGDHGALLRSITPTGTRSRVVIELSSTVDVRSFVGMLDRKFPGTELAARREHDRAARPDRSFDAEIRDRLSERQLRTLETAYYSGFFEWPRESTGEDVADLLGVSQPTFSRHFRLAQQKLFTLLFDERSATGGTDGK